ncbi:14147_t:CDS:1, partial [Funneliformis geosporum]
GNDLFEEMTCIPPGFTGESFYHDIHKANGRDYDSDCPICRG